MSRTISATIVEKSYADFADGIPGQRRTIWTGTRKVTNSQADALIGRMEGITCDVDHLYNGERDLWICDSEDYDRVAEATGLLPDRPMPLLAPSPIYVGIL